MTKFMFKSFSVHAPATKEYADNWDRIFRKKEEEQQEGEGVMRRIRLETATAALRGELVTEGVMPAWPERDAPAYGNPDVVLWGTRVFKFSHIESDDVVVYRECFAWALVKEA